MELVLLHAKRPVLEFVLLAKLLLQLVLLSAVGHQLLDAVDLSVPQPIVLLQEGMVGLSAVVHDTGLLLGPTAGLLVEPTMPRLLAESVRGLHSVHVGLPGLHPVARLLAERLRGVLAEPDLLARDMPIIAALPMDFGRYAAAGSLLWAAACGLPGGRDGGNGPLLGALVVEGMAFRLDADDDLIAEPLRGVTVSLLGHAEPKTRSDAAGRFRLEGLPDSGEVVLRAEADGFLPSLSAPIPASPGTATATVSLATSFLVYRLGPTRLAEGSPDLASGVFLAHVMDGEGRPLGGARVGVVGDGQMAIAFGAGPKAPGAAPGGGVVLDGLSGEATLRVVARGYDLPDRTFRFEPGAVTATAIHAAKAPPSPPPGPPPGVVFREGAAAAGVAVKHDGGADAPLMGFEAIPGVVARDLDADGDVDLVFTNGPAVAPALYLNDGRGRFAGVGPVSGFLGGTASQGACSADVDNDGLPELYLVGNGGAGVLYRNLGAGRFQAMAGSPPGPAMQGQSCAFADVDADGFVDLAVTGYIEGTEYASSQVDLASGQVRLYHNQGGRAFVDVTEVAAGTPGLVKTGLTYVVAFLDDNGDGFPDLLTAADFGLVRLFRNLHPGGMRDAYREVSDEVGLGGQAPSGSWMGLALGDFDGDLAEDLFVTNISGPDIPFAGLRPDTPQNLLARWDGSARKFVSEGLTRGAGDTGWSWGAEFVDVDNDAQLDLYVVGNMFLYGYGYLDGHPVQPAEMGRLIEGGIDGRRTTLFHNQGGRFRDATRSAGIDNPQDSRAVAVADLDGNGFADLVVTNLFSTPTIHFNEGNANRWLGVRAQGRVSNRDGIGSRVTVKAGGATQVRWIRAGSGYLSQSDLGANFGLGSAAQVDEVEVRFPSGATVRSGPVASNQVVVVKEP